MDGLITGTCSKKGTQYIGSNGLNVQNIYIDVLCANEVVSGKLEDDLVKQMCRLVMKQKVIESVR